MGYDAKEIEMMVCSNIKNLDILKNDIVSISSIDVCSESEIKGEHIDLQAKFKNSDIQLHIFADLESPFLNAHIVKSEIEYISLPSYLRKKDLLSKYEERWDQLAQENFKLYCDDFFAVLNKSINEELHLYLKGEEWTDQYGFYWDPVYK